MSDPRLTLGPELTGADSTAVLAVLDGVRPVIRLGGCGVSSVRAAATTASILMRMFPHTVLEGDGELGANPWGVHTLQEFASAISARPSPSRRPENDIVIAIGEEIGDANLWVGGGDWTARLGSSPQRITEGRLGLGLQAAAAQVAAEVTKMVLGPLGMIAIASDANAVWNLLDFKLEERELAVDTFYGVDLALFGAGSVASSVVGVLAMIDQLTGHASVVDPDLFDPIRNPFRYPSARGDESGPKAIWLAELLRRSGWSADATVSSVGKWNVSRAAPGFDGIAISSVDTVDGRLEVADVVARTTLTLGVAGLSLHIQREHFGDDSACPFCQYVSAEPLTSQLQVWADLTGITLERIARLALENEILSSEDVHMSVAVGRLRLEGSDELVGRRLADLVHRGYAEATIELPEGGAATVSAPYVSWMSGVLGAAEVVKAATRIPMVDRRFDIDMSGVPLGVVRRRERDKSGRCVCGPGVRTRWSGRMYEEPWNQPTPRSSPVFAQAT